MKSLFSRPAAVSLLLAALSRAYSPDTNTLLYAPLAGLHQNQSLFEQVLFAEKTPESLSFYVADARAGGSGAVANGLMPLFSKRDAEKGKRSNGWAVGVSMGYQRDALRANDIFVPGFYTFETSLGRATSESQTVAGTGLRGYFEIVLRNQRPLKNARQQNRLGLVTQSLPNDNYFLALKIGAASDNRGSGIVSQKPGFFSWAVQTALYIPLKDKQGYANLKVSPYTSCFGENFHCGMHFFYMNLFRGSPKPYSDFANHFAMAALFWRYQRSEHFSFDLEIFESLTSSPLVVRDRQINPDDPFYEKGPAIYTSRTSISTYPGAKLTLAYLF